ncbi:MAG: lysophospholipid acyltransferase family protein [Armatimonadota bacterium]
MSAWTRQVVDRGSYVLLSGLMGRLEGRPEAVVHARGARIGRIGALFSPGRTAVAVENLGRAFPEMPLAERKALAVKVWEHFGSVAADFLSSRGRSLVQLESTTVVVGQDVVDKALAQGRGALMISGHLGNWERIAAWLSLSGYPLSIIIRDANQQDVNRLVNSVRESTGSKIIARGRATRTILERLHANEIVAMLSDQNSDDAFIPLFGHMAGIATGAGVLADRTGCAVFSGACMHQGEGRYKLEFTDNIQPIGVNSFKGEAWMRGIHRWLEEEIRQNPEQWLWIHDRWRSAKHAGLV